MQHPLQIIFRDIPPSEAIETTIRKHAAKLEHICNDILHCRVSLESAGRHKHQGKLYTARVDLAVPGAEIVAGSRQPRAEHEDAYVAIRDAFEAAAGQLEEYVQRRRRETKTHPSTPD